MQVLRERGCRNSREPQGGGRDADPAGSRERICAPTNRNRLRGAADQSERANDCEALATTDPAAVHGRSVLLPGEISPDARKGDAAGRSEQSAEVVGVAGTPLRAQQLKDPDQPKLVREAAIPLRRSLPRITAPVLLGWDTLGALSLLAKKKLLSTEDRDALTAAYLCLCDLEHKLQMVDDLQTHSLPERSEELERCAVRMGYGVQDRMKAATLFHGDHQRHTDMTDCAHGMMFLGL
ncbi:MAG: hypothetical protein CAF42_008190 [Nitrospira sp. CG24B]|nr:MAG: hypothetical protein CAF42_008190 [Nitrospira sp. CG24B]